MDRNFAVLVRAVHVLLSPPARVAWIETPPPRSSARPPSVATREGGVDRNFEGGAEGGGLLDVATREGGVDRNKANDNNRYTARKASPPARVAWIETPK